MQRSGSGSSRSGELPAGSVLHLIPTARLTQTQTAAQAPRTCRRVPKELQQAGQVVRRRHRRLVDALARRHGPPPVGAEQVALQALSQDHLAAEAGKEAREGKARRVGRWGASTSQAVREACRERAHLPNS